MNTRFPKLYYHSIKILILVSLSALFVYIFSKLVFSEVDKYSKGYVSMGSSTISENNNRNLITNPRIILYDNAVKYSIMADSANYETESEITMINPVLVSESINAKAKKLIIKNDILYFTDNVEFSFNLENLKNVKKINGESNGSIL